jgi:hypothetical protein
LSRQHTAPIVLHNGSTTVLRQPFADLKYDVLFDEKAVEFLTTPNVRAVIKEYIARYNELLAASVYFKKGIFNYYNAGAIAKSLADNGFLQTKTVEQPAFTNCAVRHGLIQPFSTAALAMC